MDEKSSRSVGLRSRRRRAAGVMAVWPAAELIAAWPGAGPVGRFLPLARSTMRPGSTLMAGIGLWALARGLRRGQRPALIGAVGVLVAASAWLAVARTPVLAVVPAAVAVALVRARGAFSGGADVPSVRRGLAVLAVGVPGVVALGWWGAPGAVSGSVVLGALAGGLAGWLLTRPPVRVGGIDLRTDVASRARGIVDAHSSDHLDYFALRDDKEHFFHGSSVVAFAVVRGVCVVSPDPIGPPHEREAVWAAFRRFADEHGWLVGVLGAGEGQLDLYRQERMRIVYIGDDAVVDCQSFQLEGRRLKSLRQGVHRAARRGFRVELYEAAEVPDDLRCKIRALAVRGRLGAFERGFSMTLGRMFDPRDAGLLVGVCVGPGGEVAACCQFVPAPGGYCLDLMRRDPDAAHGVVDFILVSMIERLRKLDLQTLTLNFAAWRAIAAGDREDSVRERLLRRGLGWLSKSFQVESLWEFTRKYQPRWVSRYAAYDAIEDLVGCLLAVAKVESYWELPLIGRFMLPDLREQDGVVAPVGMRSALPSSALRIT